MRAFVHEHSLSLLLASLFVVQTVVWVLSRQAGGWWDRWVGEYILSILADTYGALVLVLATKRFIERGSAESKE